MLFENVTSPITLLPVVLVINIAPPEGESITPLLPFNTFTAETVLLSKVIPSAIFNVPPF